MATNAFFVVVCLIIVSSSQETSITVELLLVDENSVSTEDAPVDSIVYGFCPHDGSGVSCSINDNKLDDPINKLLKANLSIINNTTSKVALVAIPHCYENVCIPTLRIRCSYNSNSSIFKAATINLTGILEVRNVVMNFSTTVTISWLSPLPFLGRSSKFTYIIIGTNKTGDVVSNETVNTTYWSLNNDTICSVHNIIITAIQDGYTSTVTIEMIYPNGYCNSTSSESSKTVLIRSDVTFTSTTLIMISTTSNRDSTTIEHSVLPSDTISTVSSPTGTDSVTIATTSNLLPSTSTTDGPLENLISLVVIIPIVVCLIVVCSICGILGRYCYKRRVQQQVSGSSRIILCQCLDKANQDTVSKSNTERSTKQDGEMTGEDERNTVELTSSCPANTNQVTPAIINGDYAGQNIELISKNMAN